MERHDVSTTLNDDTQRTIGAGHSTSRHCYGEPWQQVWSSRWPDRLVFSNHWISWRWSSTVEPLLGMWNWGPSRASVEQLQTTYGSLAAVRNLRQSGTYSRWLVLLIPWRRNWRGWCFGSFTTFTTYGAILFGMEQELSFIWIEATGVCLVNEHIDWRKTTWSSKTKKEKMAPWAYRVVTLRATWIG